MQLGTGVGVIVGVSVGTPGVAVGVEDNVADGGTVAVRVGVTVADSVTVGDGVRTAQFPVPKQTALNTGTHPLTQAPDTGGPHAAWPEKLH